MKFFKAKSGFTLMELMVYIGLLGIIVIIAGQAFSDSSRMRLRSQNMLQASEVAENVAALLKADIEQTGAKTSMENGVPGAGEEYGNKFSDVYAKVYMDPDNASDDSKDSSSFSVVSQNGFDNLTMRRLRYDANGYFSGVEEVSWFVQNGSLWRNCKVLQKATDDALPEDDPCSDVNDTTTANVEMASGVTAFRVIPSQPSAVGNNIQLFPSVGEDEFKFVARLDGDRAFPVVYNEREEVNKGGKILTVTNFFQNYGVAADGKKFNEVVVIRNETHSETSWKTLCAKNGNHFTFEPEDEYEISFEVVSPDNKRDKSKMFVPGQDHMSVGFRDKDGEPIAQLNDFMFFPPLGSKSEGGGVRTMRFSVPTKVENACLVFTFACYSPLVSQGKVSITKLKVSKVPSANYNFNVYDFNSHKNDKQNVKAFLLMLDVKRNGESGHVQMVVPAPSNGPRD